VTVHESFAACLGSLDPAPRWFALTTQGTLRHDQVRWQDGDVLVFGAETRGLPAAILADCLAANRLRIPMQAGARSLNLSNAVAVAVYEAWRQLDFATDAP
jgi:tRNA (cytidine/uridine-2'-O-)-methyltransferase